MPPRVYPNDHLAHASRPSLDKSHPDTYRKQIPDQIPRPPLNISFGSFITAPPGETPKTDVQTINFSGQTLFGYVDFGGIHADAEFASAKIEDANFARSFMRKANLMNVSIYRGDFTQACFENASFMNMQGGALNFTGANLGDVNLMNAKIIRANFTGAGLVDACLANIESDDANFTGANLTRVLLGGVRLPNANFTGAILTAARFESPKMLCNANFTGANMQLVKAKGGKFNRANFTGADLQSAVFEDVDLTDTTWWGANLTGASFLNCTMSPELLNRIAEVTGKKP